MSRGMQIACGISVLFTTLAFGHIMIEDTKHMMSHHEEGQLFIIAHTIVALALGILSLAGGFCLLTSRPRPT